MRDACGGAGDFGRKKINSISSSAFPPDPDITGNASSLIGWSRFHFPYAGDTVLLQRSGPGSDSNKSDQI